MIRYYYWGHPFLSTGFGLFGGFLTILFWILVIYLIVSLISSHNEKNSKEEDEVNGTPLDILKARYAKGEINKKEYEEMKKDILKD